MQVVIIITDVNEVPVITNLPHELVFPEDMTLEQEVFVVLTEDPEGDPVYFTITSQTTSAFTISETGRALVHELKLS